jgi:excisionase family DNA binding protein
MRTQPPPYDCFFSFVQETKGPVKKSTPSLTLKEKLECDAPLTLEEAGVYLGVNYFTFREWVLKDHRITACEIGTGNTKTKLRFYKKDLDSFVKTIRVESI